MTAIHAMLGFAALTLLLVASVFLYRGLRFLRGTPINHWPRGAKPQDDAPVIKRLEDAHANCLENLPVLAAIVLAGVALQKQELLAPLAAWVLYARVGQVAAHLWGVASLQVFVRASCWSVQLGLMFWMLALLVR